MEICIVGTKKRDAMDEKLHENGKKIAKVLCVPINHLALLNDEGSSVKYRNTKLSKFDALLFKVPKSKYPLAYHIIKNLERDTAKMQSAKCFLIAASKISLFHELAIKGIGVPRTIFSEDTETISANIKNLKFPILIKVPTDKKKFMVANSQQEVMSMMDALKTLNQPLLLEEYYPESELYKLFVINGEVICTLKIKNPELNYSGGIPKKSKPSRKMIDTAISTAKTLETEIAIVKIIDTEIPKVVDVNVCPYFEEAENITSINLTGILMDRLKEISEHSKSTGVFSQIIEEFKEAVKETFS